MTARWKRRLAWCALITLLTAALLGSLAYGLARAVVQDEPLVSMTREIGTADVAQVLALVRQHDPRRVPPGQARSVLLGERDLDVLINHVAFRRLGVPAHLNLSSGQAEIQASVHLPPNPIGRWLNVQLVLRETQGLPEVAALQFGGLPVPPGWAGLLLHKAAVRAGLALEWQMAREVVQGVQFAPQRLALHYVLGFDSADRIVAAMVPPADVQRLRAYSDQLVRLAAPAQQGSSVSLARWMGPLFDLARQRSAAGGDAAAENRAAIVVLTLYATGRPLDRWVPAAKAWERPRPVRLTLAGRDDWPLHLLVSAALVTEGSSPLSKAVGLYKEVKDAHGGSGFSFNDLAADRAGTRLGERALNEPLRLQAALARGVNEADFMPAADDLPEFLPEREFKRRFGGVGEPRYAALLAEIDRRVSALPALR